MMTSRAEHRLHLREDNTLERLSEIGFRIGSLGGKTYKKMQNVLEARQSFLKTLETTQIVPKEPYQSVLQSIGTRVLNKPQTLKELLRRTEVQSEDLGAFGIELPDPELVRSPVEIYVKYEGYINREMDLIQQTMRLENFRVPEDLDFSRVRGLSGEEIEKLNLVRPRTLGQAQRISGVNPSAIKALVVHLKATR